MICRLLPYRIADGPINMAIDEALMEVVAADPSVAYFRTYGWTTPTLSLGYFQRWADAENDPRWRNLAKVRRPTGGGAILHDNELTYAVIIPASHPLARPNPALYRAVHSTFGEILSARHVDAQRFGDLNPDAERPPPASRPFLCFADRDGEDMVFQGSKIVGSAQRRRAGAILQHGSLLLGQSPAAPELKGVVDLTGEANDPEAWAAIVGEPLCRALGMEPVASEFPECFGGIVERLRQTVYLRESWNKRR